jgi:putative hydrolase of the HAD superfamily
VTNIRAVTIDLDETMLDRRVTFEVFVRSQMNRFGPFFQNVDRDRLFERVLELDRDGSTHKDEVFGSVAREYSLGVEAGEVLAEDFRARFPDECVVFPHLQEVLERLNASGYLLAIITNGGVEIQQRKIDVMGIAPAFQDIAISEAEGCRKPDAELFHRVLDRLGVKPEEAVHVGDNPRTDIQGAKNAGLWAIWTRSRTCPEPAEADMVIEGIAELPGAIDKLESP